MQALYCGSCIETCDTQNLISVRVNQRALEIKINLKGRIAQP